MARVVIDPAVPDQGSLDNEIARLRGLNVGDLRARWQTVFRRRAPPQLPRHLLFHILASVSLGAIRSSFCLRRFRARFDLTKWNLDFTISSSSWAMLRSTFANVRCSLSRARSVGLGMSALPVRDRSLSHRRLAQHRCR